jgi:hypothetical protein
MEQVASPELTLPVLSVSTPDVDSIPTDQIDGTFKTSTLGIQSMLLDAYTSANVSPI